jgi:nucleoside-diphosphate-sugar epimerase
MILGGVGFIGRHLVSYLAANKLASKIAVCDKVLPEVAGLTPTEMGIFKSDLVVYKQVNLSREATIDKVFELDGGNWDIVINLAAATKYSQANEVYQEHIIDVARVCATAAKKFGVKRFVQVSTGQVYDSGKKPSDEAAKIKPWTALAKASLKAEEDVAASGVPYNIVRPSVVYGPGDQSGITPRLIMGAVYQKLGKTMECLWDKGLRLNTVHVRDVVKALFLIATKAPEKEVYNLCDSTDTDQGSINKLIAELFAIKTDFLGAIQSSIATTLSMKTVADVANDKHLKPWSDLLKEQGIVDSPLTPYLDEELLYNNSYALDGQKIVTSLGFVYDVPQLTIDQLVEVIQDFEAKKYFPHGLLKYTPK